MTDQTHPQHADITPASEPELTSAEGAIVPQSRGELIELHEADKVEVSPKKPRRVWIAVAVLGAAAVAVGVTLGPTSWRILTQKDATLTMPTTIGNLTRDDSTQAKETASDLVTALRSQIDLDASQGAIYADPAAGAGQSIMIFGGTTLLWSPEKELDTVLKLMDDAGDGVKDLTNVDPGPLGGTMKCGATGSTASPMAVCGWADHGSIALALFPGRTPTDGAVLMRQFRAATLTR